MKQTKRQLLAASLAALMLMSQTGVITYAASEDSTGSSATETATTATVSSLAELQTALADSNITQITITGNADAIQLSDGSSVTLKATDRDVTIISNVIEPFYVTNGTLTLGEGLTITNNNYGFIFVTGSSAKIIIDGANITHSATTYAMCDIQNGGTIEVKSGTLNATDASAIVVQSNSKAIISGGTVSSAGVWEEVDSNKGWVAVYSYEGATNATIEITGGTITSESGIAVDSHAGSTATISGEKTVITGTTAVCADGGNVTISGGTLSTNTANGAAVSEGTNAIAGSLVINADVVVKGTVPEGSLATGTELVEDESGNTVVGYAVTGVTLSAETLALEVDDTATLTATIEPENATNQTVTWTSSDDDIATVADGVVTAVSAGTATITATTSNDLTAECAVTVTEAEPAVFNKSAADFAAGTVVTQTKKVKADDGETMSYRFVMKITEAQAEAATKATFAISNGATTVNKDVTVCYTSIVAGGNTVSEDGYVYVAYTVTEVPTTVELSATITLS